jgi:hypothetical protein
MSHSFNLLLFSKFETSKFMYDIEKFIPYQEKTTVIISSAIKSKGLRIWFNKEINS